MSSSTTNNGLMNELVDGMSEVGTVKAEIYFWVGLLVVFCLVVLAIYALSTNTDDEYINVTAIITKSECIQKVVDEKIKFNCILTLEYIVNNTKHIGVLDTTGSIHYMPDQRIQVRVSKKDPKTVKMPAIMSTSAIASILFSVAAVILGGCYLNYYLTHKYKFYAATSGASTAFNMIRSTF